MRLILYHSASRGVVMLSICYPDDGPTLAKVMEKKLPKRGLFWPFSTFFVLFLKSTADALVIWNREMKVDPFYLVN